MRCGAYNPSRPTAVSVAGVNQDAEQFVRSCVACVRGKASRLRLRGSLQLLPIAALPWEDIARDLIVGLPGTVEGWDAILTIVCRLTEMARFIATTQTVTAEGVALLLVRDAIGLLGVPAAITSDRDTRFSSVVWRHVRKKLSIQLQMSTASHPQTGRLAERTKQTCEQMWRCAILGNDAKWGDVLPILEVAYNSSAHASRRPAPSDLSFRLDPTETSVSGARNEFVCEHSYPAPHGERAAANGEARAQERTGVSKALRGQKEGTSDIHARSEGLVAHSAHASSR